MPLALYIHWPFCKAKCPYCDFNSHVSASVEMDRWLAAYMRELDYFVDSLGHRNISSIFFGGGTPSLMDTRLVEALLEHIAARFSVDSTCEITLEANPTSSERKKFRDFKSAGVNRVSIGVQALNDDDLAFLGREHSAGAGMQTVLEAASVFERFSFDLIYARPGQTVAGWEQELTEALAMAGNHLSLYQLTIEKGTPFYAAHKQGRFVIPDGDIAAEMYALTEMLTQAEGLSAYEVSNYAAPGHESRHNLTYWQYGDYLGIGPGAHSRLSAPEGQVGKRALMMIHAPDAWLGSVTEKGHGIQQDGMVEGDELIGEVLMMGLRLKEGLSQSRFAALTGRSCSEALNREALQMLQKEGLLEVDDDVLRPTFRGRLLLNSMTGKLLG